MKTRLRAGIIGLGQIGSRFDEDPKRKGVWTHAGAYAHVPQVVLVAGTDPDESARCAFESRWGVKGLYGDYRQMLERERLDLVSVCLPTSLHAEAVRAAVDAGVRGIFCEKPLAGTVEEGRGVVEYCRDRGIVLAVNYSRRWDPSYLWPQGLMRQGFLGRLCSVSAIYSGQIYHIGTHLIDIMQMYAGKAEWVVGKWAGDARASDPTVAGLLGFQDGVSGTLLSMPERTDLVSEVDLLGTEGRLRITENGRTLDAYRFQESLHYSGYRELALVETANPNPTAERFVGAVQDIIQCIETGAQPACSGADGLAVLETAAALCQSAQAGGIKQVLEVYA